MDTNIDIILFLEENGFSKYGATFEKTFNSEENRFTIIIFDETRNYSSIEIMYTNRTVYLFRPGEKKVIYLVSKLIKNLEFLSIFYYALEHRHTTFYSDTLHDNIYLNHHLHLDFEEDYITTYYNLY